MELIKQNKDFGTDRALGVNCQWKLKSVWFWNVTKQLQEISGAASAPVSQRHWRLQSKAHVLLI